MFLHKFNECMLPEPQTPETDFGESNSGWQEEQFRWKNSVYIGKDEKACGETEGK